jgi:SulP family sulfate permease
MINLESCQMASWASRLANRAREYVPKSVVCWQEGYTREILKSDIWAGVTVGIIALPLAMAFAIASGVDPERGLYTAIIAGFLISLLGGSRVQIGGPTGAFVVVVYSIVERHGYAGLAVATIMAGIMMVLMGLARFGVLLKFIPYPVTTGFTTGIAVVIFSSQIKDFFGLPIETVPADFLEKWDLYFRSFTINHWTTAIATSSLLMIFWFRKKYPRVPGVIIAVAIATIVTQAASLPVETIETKFGAIPRMLSAPSLPPATFDMIQELFHDAITLALLGAIESLLSAVVADGMTGHRHRSNCELVAQGFANVGSALFGGIPATGAIARTTANIQMNAKTPLAGMVHALTLLLLMLLLAPLAGKVPLAVLAAVLVYVAWNMAELDHFFAIMKANTSDSLVLCITFLLTVLIDLTVAVRVGVILAALLFMKKMTDTTSVKACRIILEEEEKEGFANHDSELLFRKDIPKDVAVFEINGPFFFGISDALSEQLRQLPEKPKAFILRMGKVPLIDTSGIHALKQFQKKCQKKGILFLLSGVRGELKHTLQENSIEKLVGKDHIFAHLEDALAFLKTHDNCA